VQQGVGLQAALAEAVGYFLQADGASHDDHLLADVQTGDDEL
jgi:hypothetical protein